MEKKKVWIVILSVVACLLFVTSAFSQTPIKWRGQTAYTPPPNVGPYQSAMHGGGNSANVMAKFLAQITKGQVQLTIAQPGAIVPVAQMFNAISKGVLDYGGHYWAGYHAGMLPEADVEIGLPFAWERPEEAWDAVFNRGLLQEMRKIYAEHNIYWIPIISNTGYSFATNYPCPNSAAIKGKKFRAAGIFGELVKKLGGSPLMLPSGELYMALKMGTIDGCIFGLENLENYKLKEVWKNYISNPNLSTILTCELINMDTFKKLPADIRAMIDNYAAQILLENTMLNYTWDRYWTTKASKTNDFKLVNWPDEDVVKVRKIAIELWDTVGAKSPRCAKLVDVVKTQMRELGKME